MLKYRFHALVIAFLVLPFAVLAQQKKPVRLELQVKDNSEVYKVVPCEENGCAIIFLSSEGSEDGKMLWITTFLDKTLTEQKRFEFDLPRGFVLEEALYDNNRLVAFFYTGRSSADTNFYLVDFNFADGKYSTITYPVPGRSGISHFAISDNYAIAGINTRNDESMVLRYDMRHQNISLLSTGISDKTVIESVGINGITNGFSVILRTTQSLKRRNYYVVKYTSQGQSYKTHLLSKFDNYLINTAYIHEINNSSDIIIGSYGTTSRTRTIDGREITGVASTGFFSIVLSDQGEENINMYDFSEFDRFYRYLRRPTEIAPRRTLLRRDRTSREYSITDYNLLAHDIFIQNGQFVFLAEAYYPEYRNVTTMVYDYYGRPYPSTYSVFDGFRYLTTFIAGFNENGELQWNNDLELTDALTQSLRERVTPYVYDSTALMLSYVDGDRIAYKIIDKGQNLTSVSYAKVEPLNRHDKVQKESNSYILPWYNDYFLVYGYQTVRNSYSSDRSKNIFYLSKVAFRL